MSFLLHNLLYCFATISWAFEEFQHLLIGWNIKWDRYLLLSSTTQICSKHSRKYYILYVHLPWCNDRTVSKFAPTVPEIGLISRGSPLQLCVSSYNLNKLVIDVHAFDVGLFFFALRYVVAPPFPVRVVIGQLGSVARLRNEDPAFSGPWNIIVPARYSGYRAGNRAVS